MFTITSPLDDDVKSSIKSTTPSGTISLSTNNQFLQTRTNNQSSSEIQINMFNSINNPSSNDEYKTYTSSLEVKTNYSQFDSSEETGFTTTDETIFEAESILQELMDELFLLEIEHNCSVKTFVETTKLEDGEKAINITREHLNALQKVVNKLKKVNEDSYVDEHIKNITYIHKYEMMIKEKQNILYALENLRELGMNISVFIDLLYKFKDHYEIYIHRYYDTELLLDLVNGRKQQIQILRECIMSIKELRNYINKNKLENKFKSKSMEWLLDTVTWRKLLETLKKNLIHEEHLLNTHKIFDFFKNVVAPVVMTIVFAVGIFGNGLLLTIFTRHDDMRTAPNLMLINLAFGEFLSLCFSIPTAYLYNLTAYGESFPLACKICAFFRFQGIAISAYSLIGLSIQRYLILSNSSEIRGFKTKGKIKSILIIWIFGSCISIPNTIFAGEKNGYCFADSSIEHRRLTTIWNVITLSMVPVLLNTIFSSITVTKLKDTVNQMPGEDIGQGRVKQARKLTSKTILTLTVLFACCYIPYFFSMFIYTWLNLSVEVLAYRYVLFISYLLIFVNSCLNPIALYIMSQKYRHYFNKYLVCLKLKNNAVVESAVGSTSLETQL
ncbi:hypothetical protein L9F63_018152 [Diploptera punctata]|uniref:G-protein coupled receptors family 1 profile domain-containing protein n=1 Tax=Diploptera punctata TaxID=6984 RepID=A0AAD7ZY13_DIPPU|nr:hypothetical protein L9F63_018152 [Diploptera punctata]